MMKIWSCIWDAGIEDLLYDSDEGYLRLTSQVVESVKSVDVEGIERT
jgi:hypothetical protein